jgi:hypothetical protein
MNKITKEIGNILNNEIYNEAYDLKNSGLSVEQIDEIKKFSSTYSRNNLMPFPLKMR